MAERDELKAVCDTGAKVVKFIKPHEDNEGVFAKIKEAKEFIRAAGCPFIIKGVLSVVDAKKVMDVGADVFKALALGAQGVCVGRAIMNPLKESGEQSGVEIKRPR